MVVGKIKQLWSALESTIAECQRKSYVGSYDEFLELQQLFIKKPLRSYDILPDRSAAGALASYVIKGHVGEQLEYFLKATFEAAATALESWAEGKEHVVDALERIAKDISKLGQYQMSYDKLALRLVSASSKLASKGEPCVAARSVAAVRCMPYLSKEAREAIVMLQEKYVLAALKEVARSKGTLSEKKFRYSEIMKLSSLGLHKKLRTSPAYWGRSVAQEKSPEQKLIEEAGYLYDSSVRMADKRLDADSAHLEAKIETAKRQLEESIGSVQKYRQMRGHSQEMDEIIDGLIGGESPELTELSRQYASRKERYAQEAKEFAQRRSYTLKAIQDRSMTRQEYTDLSRARAT